VRAWDGKESEDLGLRAVGCRSGLLSQREALAGGSHMSPAAIHTATTTRFIFIHAASCSWRRPQGEGGGRRHEQVRDVSTCHVSHTMRRHHATCLALCQLCLKADIVKLGVQKPSHFVPGTALAGVHDECVYTVVAQACVCKHPPP
jgi:hypothetical protein